MTEDPHNPPQRANKTYVVALSTTAAATLAAAVLQFLGKGDVNEMRKDVGDLKTNFAVMQAQGAQQNQTLVDIRAALAPLIDGERERLKMEKVVRDMVGAEFLKK